MRAPRLVACALLLVATACSGPSEATAGPSPRAGCEPGALETLDPEVLTVATGPFVYPPWVNGGERSTGQSGDPRDGEGFDAAVALGVADRLGYDADEVEWTSVPFADAIGAGPKPFDLDVNQVTIRDERRAQVDLSVPYYTMRSAVVTVAGRRVAEASVLADLDGVPLGVVRGSAGVAAVERLRGDEGPTTVVDDQDAARGALTSGQVDALVVDLSTAAVWDTDDTLLVDGVVVGQLAGHPQDETYGLVLPLDSPLTACVDDALTSMREDGTLDRLEETWLVEEPGYPLLE